MKLLFSIVLAGALILPAFSQEKFTISGYIKDSEDGEELIGVTVFVEEISSGTATNFYGFYSITLPAGSYHLIYTYVGYHTISREVELTENKELNIDLPSEMILLEQVVITGEREDAHVTDIQMSRQEINTELVRKLPALFGEPDIIKMVQMQPGVIAVAEGTSNYFVRGGSGDQNLILIDEAPVYDPSHFFGLFSVFNADVIKKSELYKGGIPAQFGGRLSSILDVRTKDGNDKKFGGSAGLGILASRLMLEGPIKKESSSFIVSARRSYIDLFLKGQDIDKVFFYDANAKLNWKKGNKNRFYLAGYIGRDVQQFQDDGKFGWGNATGTFRWNHLFNERVFSNTSLIFSNFDYGLEIYDPTQGLKWTANMQEASFKEDLNLYLSPQNELSFGYHLSYRRFSPGTLSPNDPNSIFKTTELAKMYALDHALYFGNTQKIGTRTLLQYGIRLSIFQNIGESTIYTYQNQKDNINVERIDSTHYGPYENIKTFINPEPRFSARYLLTDASSLKVSYQRTIQNIHLMSNGTVSLPFNTWTPSSPYLDPQKADQIAVGYFRNVRDNSIELSSEIYYKWMRNLTDFADNANVFFNLDLPVEFRSGDSDSYGLELMAKKTKGDLQGFVAYTYSKTDRIVEDANHGLEYPANYDRRHNVSVVTSYELNNRWSFGSTFVYASGRPITLPVGRYEYDNYNVNYYTGRNQYRLPAYHRLDLAATLTPRKNDRRKWKSSWVFGVYNVYNRQNPFTVYTRTKQDKEGNIIGDGSEKEARLVSLFPILPSVTYNIQF